MEEKNDTKKELTFKEKITNYLKNWEQGKSYRHKITVVTLIFLVLISFFGYRLTVAFNDQPINVMEDVFTSQTNRMNKVSKTNDSIDRAIVEMEQLKLIKYQEYIKEQKLKDSIEIITNELLNEKK
jgi:hypothetical protein